MEFAMPDLLHLDSHFAFGQNWADYAQTIDAERLCRAEEGLTRLLGDVHGRTFLDIGCGSGIHSATAARLGAARIVAVDLDPASVETTRRVLTQYAPSVPYDVRACSVFDLPSEPFDIVYSWGVLHHTGDMWRAIEKAASLVKVGGTLAIAIYHKTPMCSLWRIEKRLYSHAPKSVQAAIRAAYKAAFSTGLLVTGRNPFAYVRNYTSNRGMNWHHDVHDWLGGYPYESASPHEVVQFLALRGLALDRQFLIAPALHGIFGTGCSEYVFKRTGPV